MNSKYAEFCVCQSQCVVADFGTKTFSVYSLIWVLRTTNFHAKNESLKWRDCAFKVLLWILLLLVWALVFARQMFDDERSNWQSWTLCGTMDSFGSLEIIDCSVVHVQWHRIASDDGFWSTLSTLISQLRFAFHDTQVHIGKLISTHIALFWALGGWNAVESLQ